MAKPFKFSTKTDLYAHVYSDCELLAEYRDVPSIETIKGWFDLYDASFKDNPNNEENEKDPYRLSVVVDLNDPGIRKYNKLNYYLRIGYCVERVDTVGSTKAIYILKHVQFV